MRPLLAALVVSALVVTVAPAVSASVTPALRTVPKASVLTLSGRGFVAGERVGLVVSADRVHRVRVTADARGAFRLRLAGVSPCVVWTATASGSRSGRERFRSGTVDCRSSIDPEKPTGPVPPAGTGIAGEVRRGPIMPVCVAGQPCETLAAGVSVEIADGHGTVARTLTGSDGRFAVYLPAGTYTVTAEGSREPEVAVTVHAGDFATVALSIDTGIR